MILWLKYPFLCVSLAQIMGVIASYVYAENLNSWYIELICVPAVFLILSATLIVESNRSVRRAPSRLNALLWCCAAFLWGGVLVYFTVIKISPSDIRAQMGEKTELVAIVKGELLESPTIYQYDSINLNYRKDWRNKLSIKEISFSNGEEFISAEGELQVSCPEILPENFTAGALVKVEGVIKLPSQSNVPDEFNYRKYLHSQNIYYVLTTEGKQDWNYIGLNHNFLSLIKNFAARLRLYSARQLAHGYSEDDPYIGMFQAMTLGKRDALRSEFREVFINAGTMHLFAFSGANVAIIASLLIGFFSICRLPRKLNITFVLLFICFYTILVGADPPSTRAAIMLGIILVSQLFHRPPQLLNSLGVALFLLLSWEPIQLFQTSFQLSFIVTLFIILAADTVIRFTSQSLDYDPFLPKEFITSRMKFQRVCLIGILSDVYVSVIGWLASLPLCVYYFQMISIIGIPVNIIVVPLMFPIQALSLFSIAVGILFPWLCELINNVAWILLFFMEWICREAEKLPYSYIHFYNWQTWCWFSYYVGLISLFGIFFLKKTYCYLCAGISFLLILLPFLFLGGEKNLTITVFNAQDGSCIYVKDKGKRRNYLIDTGSEWFVQNRLTPYLRRVITPPEELNAVILTHGDAAHLKGMQIIFEHLSPKKIYFNPLKSRSPYMRRWQSVKEGSALERGDEIDEEMKVLHPSVQDTDFTRADQQAIVLMLRKYGKSVLFISDLDPEGQERLLEREENLKCDVLVCGKSNYEYAFRTGFLDACSPKVILIESVWKPENLNPEVEDKGFKVFVTGEDGTIKITLSQENSFIISNDQEICF